MTDFTALKRQKRIWKIGFFIELLVVILFILLCIPPGIAQKSPIAYYKEWMKKEPVFPVAYFLHNPNYPILQIAPTDNRASSINLNNGEITIRFSRPMSSSVDNIVRNISITYQDNLGKLDFSPYWTGQETLDLRFNRNIAGGEKISCMIQVSDRQGKALKPFVLQYR